jgi:hypothetical protein
VDVGVVCPGTPRLLALGTAQTPSRAVAVYSDIEVAKHGDQSSFVPFIVQTGRRITAAGLEFFDTVSGALEGDTGKVRAARRPISRWGIWVVLGWLYAVTTMQICLGPPTTTLKRPTWLIAKVGLSLMHMRACPL